MAVDEYCILMLGMKVECVNSHTVKYWFGWLGCGYNCLCFLIIIIIIDSFCIVLFSGWCKLTVHANRQSWLHIHILIYVITNIQLNVDQYRDCHPSTHCTLQNFLTFLWYIYIYMFQWKCKSQLRISGISFHVYWGSVFFTSLVVYLVPATICLIIVLAMQVGVLCIFMHLPEKVYLYM